VALHPVPIRETPPPQLDVGPVVFIVPVVKKEEASHPTKVSRVGKCTGTIA
jgi:hypothetical protein